jgi:hypothetical protein
MPPTTPVGLYAAGPWRAHLPPGAFLGCQAGNDPERTGLADDTPLQRLLDHDAGLATLPHPCGGMVSPHGVLGPGKT